MDMPRIAFFDTKPYTRETFDRVNADFGYRLKFFPNRLDADTVALAKGFQVVCVFVNDRVDREVVDALEGLGVGLVALRCAGFNNVDLAAASGRLRVVRVPAYSPHAVAEHTAALMLALDRKVHKAYNRTREANFTLDGLMGFDLFGKTAGVIGTGRIGCAMARILRGFGMTVLAFDKVLNPQAAQEAGFTYVGLEDLLCLAHVVTLHCPLTPATDHLINAERLALMRDGVMLLNTGRGRLIDSQALIAALKTRKVGYAGLDVYEEEEDCFFEDLSATGLDDDVLSRLLSFPNVLVTSHQGFFTREAVDQIALTTLENIRAYLAGEALANEVVAT
jgi:D-lactate dehydrogenase